MAGEITPAEFIIEFSEFASVNPALIQSIIDQAVFFLQPYQGVSAYRILQLYLTAHILYIRINAQDSDGDASSSNPLTSATVGSVSADYGINSGSMDSIESQLNSTSYGQLFFMYRRQARYRRTPYSLI